MVKILSAHLKHLRAIDKQILIEFYRIQWNDIHEMNNLDWRIALIFIPLIGAFSAVVGILSQWVPPEVTYYIQSIQAFGWAVFMLCLYGLWTVAKGQAHSMLKFKTLSMVEKDLSLNGYTFERSKCGRFWPVIVCRRFLLFIVYFVLGALSLTMVIIPVDKWSLSTLWQNSMWWFGAILYSLVTIGTLYIHYRDYKLHLK